MVDFAELRRRTYESASPEERARIDEARRARDAAMARSRPISATFVRTAHDGHWRRGKVVETGRETKAIRMRIDERPSAYADDPRVLVFEGGPTGHEAYRLDRHFVRELARRDRGDDWSICAGTTGSWPACSVSRLDVLAFVSEMAPDLIPAP